MHGAAMRQLELFPAERWYAGYSRYGVRKIYLAFGREVVHIRDNFYDTPGWLYDKLALSHILLECQDRQLLYTHVISCDPGSWDKFISGKMVRIAEHAVEGCYQAVLKDLTQI